LLINANKSANKRNNEWQAAYLRMTAIINDWWFLRRPLDSMRAAMLTVSPKRQ